MGLHKTIINEKKFPSALHLYYLENASISRLIGKTLVKYQVSNDKDFFALEDSDGIKYIFYHNRGCCENVSIEDIEGNLDDLLNSPIMKAVESKSNNHHRYDDLTSSTWTYYKFATIKGYVDIRWFGSSNGNYSEEVDFATIELKANLLKR